MSLLDTTVRFRGYQYYGVVTPVVFHPGEILRVEAEEADGVLHCIRLDERGQAVSGVTDMVFAEEVDVDLKPGPSA